MNGATLPHSIGDLSVRTGVPVRTIRFYSDAGLLPPSHRTPAGYRRYGDESVGRLRLICVLRDLDVDLTTVRRVLDGGLSVADVAAAHLEATELQIRTLRLRQSVLRLVARRGSSPEETLLMHRLSRLTAEERRHLVADFVAGACARRAAGRVGEGAACPPPSALPGKPSRNHAGDRGE
ncbi:MerR family transcriptional regulator, partial [Streptomyces parvulus]|uniref:helix-turn-helix domain-containing protein n=1 Tax=Streptomyces parvulus TaxID=146923 RepID=UPI0036CAA716